MTVYELARKIAGPDLDRLMQAGLVNRTTGRQLQIYEMFSEQVRRGVSRMQAYTNIAEEYFTSEENVRKIIRKYRSRVA